MSEFEIKEFYEPTKKATSLMILLGSNLADFAFKLLELGRLKTKKSVQVVCPSAGLGEEFYVLLQPSMMPSDLDFWWEDFLIGSRDRFRSLEFREYFLPTRCQVKIGRNIVKVANWDSSSAAWVEESIAEAEIDD